MGEKKIKYAKYLCENIVASTNDEYELKLKENVELYIEAIKNGYFLVIDDIAEILDLQHQFIQRKILHEDLVEYIAIHPEVRTSLMRWVADENYLGRKPLITVEKLFKRVLINKNSFISFLNTHLHKVGEYTVFSYNREDDFYLKYFDRLCDKYKGFKRLKTVFKELEDKLNEGCKYKHQFSIIFDDEKLKLYSSQSLKKKKEFKHDMQLYRYLHRINYVKYNLVLPGDSLNKKEYRSIQDFPMARYSNKHNVEGDVFNDPVIEAKFDIINIQLDKSVLESFGPVTELEKTVFMYFYKELI